jgi:hypothetical protein
MRFINLELLDKSRPEIRQVLDDLDTAKARVLAEPDPDKRRDLIKSLAKRWSALRPYLSELSHDKCWYVECRNPGTDDDVDHFRPKLKVDEASGHPGYYWLAFDWQNFRLSCHRSNRPRVNSTTGETGGKADHFPLVEENLRAWSPADDWRAEQPGLLDPINPEDPPLVTFLPNGQADLSPDYKQFAIANKRWDFSRLYLHINWPDFSDDRLVLYQKVSRLVERGKREEPTGGPGSSASDAFKDIVRDLQEVMAPQQDYSSAARIYIESFKYLWWVRLIVLR